MGGWVSPRPRAGGPPLPHCPDPPRSHPQVLTDAIAEHQRRLAAVEDEVRAQADRHRQVRARLRVVDPVAEAPYLPHFDGGVWGTLPLLQQRSKVLRDGDEGRGMGRAGAAEDAEGGGRLPILRGPHMHLPWPSRSGPPQMRGLGRFWQPHSVVPGVQLPEPQSWGYTADP